jgi:5-(hydroxymethyl)furfural/furfural oxidase
MYGVAVNRGAWHSLGQRLGGFLVWVNKAYSQGWVHIRSPHVDMEPRVELNLLSDERDRLRLADALQRLAAIYRHPAMRKVAKYPFAASYTERSRDLAVVSWENRLRTAPLAIAVDSLAPLRRRVMRNQVGGGNALFDLVRDDAALQSFLSERVHGTWHCCGTARMGRESDAQAVTDSRGRVFGIRGLRIADASLMPSVPRANTNLPVIMIGEKIADSVLADWQ